MSELPPSSEQEPQGDTPEDLRLLYEQALHREQIERVAKEYWHYEATHDRLTGLRNLRGLEEILQNNPAPQALLFIDSDRLKVVNDTLGHERGDEVIKQTGSLIIESIRPNDDAARVGGDEFVVILDPHKRVDIGEDTGSPDYIAEVDGLIVSSRRRLAEATEAFLGREENADLLAIGFRLSVGGAIWQEGMTIDDLLRIADEDMYRDKGRHRR